MRVLFMGTPDFSVPALENLAKEHDVIGVITQKDKPKGRGHQMQFTPVKEAAVRLDIPVYQPDKVKDEEFVNIMREMNPDVIVVIAFGQILSREILDMPRYGCINVHASILPKYRGAAPIQWAVIDGEKVSGVTTMYMADGIDTGDIIDIKEYVLDENETGGSLFDKLSVLGGELILETLDKLENGTSTRTPQDELKATHVGKITKELGNINFNDEAIKIERLIRGLNPWPSAFTSVDGKNLKIWSADVVEENCEAEPGTIYEITKNGFKIATGKGALAVKELQLEGKKRMNAGDFLRGYNLKEGTKLG